MKKIVCHLIQRDTLAQATNRLFSCTLPGNTRLERRQTENMTDLSGVQISQ